MYTFPVLMGTSLALSVCLGRPAASQATWLHGAHPCAGGASHLPPAGQGPHPDVALPELPALPALRAPHPAHVRGLPGALLPEVRLRCAGPQRHHGGAPHLHRDDVPCQGTRLHAPEQQLLTEQW